MIKTVFVVPISRSNNNLVNILLFHVLSGEENVHTHELRMSAGMRMVKWIESEGGLRVCHTDVRNAKYRRGDKGHRLRLCE